MGPTLARAGPLSAPRTPQARLPAALLGQTALRAFWRLCAARQPLLALGPPASAGFDLSTAAPRARRTPPGGIADFSTTASQSPIATPYSSVPPVAFNALARVHKDRWGDRLPNRYVNRLMYRLTNWLPDRYANRLIQSKYLFA